MKMQRSWWRGLWAVMAALTVVGMTAGAAPGVAAETAATNAPPEPAAWPALAQRRVLVISIDGLRPDLMLRGQTPTLHELMSKGTSTLWAQTTAVAITLPSHTSMITGVAPSKHGVEWNDDLPLKEQVYPRYPTLMELAHQAGITSAMVAGKSKFIALAKPGTQDWTWIAPEATKAADEAVGDAAVGFIKEHQPRVLFVHFPHVDAVGHAKGWGSPEQMQQIAVADGQVKRLLDALEEMHLRDTTMVIVTADHGGSGRRHGADDPRSRYIPWIITGPGVTAGLDLTLYPALLVRTEDTFATVAWYLELPLAPLLDGKPVADAFKPVRTPARYE